MENIKKLIEQTSFHNSFNQIAFRFYISYSRFEYALKRSGFIFSPHGQTFAQASIEEFSNSVHDNINLEDTLINDHVQYVFNNPPNVLHVVNERLQWIPLTPQNNTLEFILRCMRSVRNNLFHGNKQLPGNSIRRNIRLVSSFLHIINYLIEQNQEVKDYFLSDLED